MDINELIDKIIKENKQEHFDLFFLNNKLKLKDATIIVGDGL